jgi:hypothetical protein
MKTIKEEIKHFQLCASMDIDAEKEINDGEFDVDELVEESIMFGIQLAQRWIPVSKELPKVKNHNFSDLVLTKNKFNNILLERYDYEYNHFNEIRYDAIETGDGQVTHWRPIERS